MSYQDIYAFTPLYNRKMKKYMSSTLRFAESESAQFRFRVIEFQKKYGTQAAKAAFNVSHRTIFRWKQKLKVSKGVLASLIPTKTTPHCFRRMETPPVVVAEIKRLRETHNRLGKEKIKPLLDEYCRAENISSIAESTIGKVIKRYNLYPDRTKRIYHDPSSRRGQHKVSYKQKVKRSPKSKSVGYLEIDTVTRFVHGIRLYIYNAVDIVTKFQFSYGYTTLTSRNTVDFFTRLELVYPRVQSRIHTVQTDNGLEFLGLFRERLEQHKIKHLFIYPRCPKINAYIERANRTLSEEFLEEHQYLVIEGIQEFNQKLIDYLIWYNTKRVHKALNNVSPINYLLQTYPKCQMCVTYTAY